MNSQSLLPVAGWWVAWVYALSLSLPMVLGPIDNQTETDFTTLFDEWAREVYFKAASLKVSSDDPDGLAVLTAVATKPAPIAGNVQVIVEEKTAKRGVDFEVAERGAAIYFEKDATEGELRILPKWGPDILIKNDSQWQDGRSFNLRLETGPDAVAGSDRAMCLITIIDGDKPPPSDALTSVGFVRAEVPVPLRDLATSPFEVEAESAVDKPVPITFSLHHTLDGERRLLKEFVRTLPTGERRIKFQLADVLRQEELAKFGLTDTGAPGRDETYEIDLMASAPLFPDNPRTCRIVAENTNPPPNTRLVYFDKNKREIPYLDEEGYVTVEYDGKPLRNRSTHTISIDGIPLPGEVVVDAACQRGGLVSLSNFDWAGRRGRRCSVASSCGGGGCRGQGGGSGKALCGEPISGDYMLIVVNNERLHEPDDRIVDEVRRALADDAAKPYGNGAIIINPDDEDTLTPTGGGPKPDKMFQPFNKEGHDVTSQLKRIEEVVARKREAAAKPDLRAVVVWPERGLHGEAGVRPVASEDLHPMSFLVPDAAASQSRGIEEGLVPRGVGGRAVTVRAPKEGELQAHLENVISEGRGAQDESAK